MRATSSLYRSRGISNTLAGMIVLSFLILVFVPLIINMLTTTTQQSLHLAQSIIEKIGQASPALNITLDYTQSNTITKVYRIINTDTRDQALTLLTVEDNSGNVYLVRPGACITTACSAGSASVKAKLVKDAIRIDNIILVHPRGEVQVEVSYGKLLGVLLRNGAYARVETPPLQAGNTTTAEYAEVAGSVKTNYFQLGQYQDITDLVNSNDVALGTGPNASSTNSEIMWKNMIKSRCVHDGNIIEGGFRPRNGLNGTTIQGLAFINIEPYGGSFILGGGGGNYNQYPFPVRLLLSGYTLAAPPGKDIGLIVARNGDAWAAAFALYPHYMYLAENSTATNDAINAWRNFIPQKIYNEQAVRASWIKRWTDYSTTNVKAYFDIPYIGVIIEYDDRYHFMIYCPAKADHVSVNEAGDALITIPKCEGIATNHYYYSVELANVTIKINNGRYHGDASTGYIWGNTSYAYLEADQVDLYYLVAAGSTALYHQPFRLKLDAETTYLAVRDEVSGSIHYGKEAFGYYFYNGIVLNDNLITSYFNVIMLRNARVTVFEFAPGDTSGIAPFTHVIDTDGNSLLEIVFSDEDVSPGWSNTEDDFGTIYVYGRLSNKLDVGCEEMSLNKLYMKFIGNNYAVDGTKIAQVSIQIRYTFHDNAGDDVDDVDDPKQYLMSFQLITPNGTVFMTSDYIYQQLQNLEDTWPPNHNWVTDSVFLLVPNETGPFYVAYVVNDPYGWQATNNDPDFTIAVEWLGMWYLHR